MHDQQFWLKLSPLLLYYPSVRKGLSCFHSGKPLIKRKGNEHYNYYRPGLKQDPPTLQMSSPKVSTASLVTIHLFHLCICHPSVWKGLRSRNGIYTDNSKCTRKTRPCLKQGPPALKTSSPNISTPPLKEVTQAISNSVTTGSEASALLALNAHDYCGVR